VPVTGTTVVSYSHRSIKVLILISPQSLFTRTDLLLRRVSTHPTSEPSHSLAVLSPLQETAGSASLMLPSPISRQCSRLRGQEGRTLHRRRTIHLHLQNTTSIIHCAKSKCSHRRLPYGAHLSPLLPHKRQGWNCTHLWRKELLRSPSSFHER